MRQPRSSDKKYKIGRYGFNNAAYQADLKDWQAQEDAKAAARAARWQTQSSTSTHVTKVKSGVNRDTGQPQTEIIIADKSDGANHTHATYDQDGDINYGRSGT